MAAPPTSAELAFEGVRVVSSCLYLVAAAFVLRREVDRESRLAQYGFAAWWAAIAVVGFAAIPTSLGLNLAELGLPVWRAWIYILFPLIFLGIAGLVYYLLYIYTGNRRLWLPVTLFYLALTAMTVWLVEGFGPYLGVDETGQADILFRSEHPRVVLTLFSLGIVVPPLAAAIAFFLLFFRLEEPLRRYRVAMVSGGIITWFAYSLFGTILRFITNTEEQTLFGQFVGQLLGLTAAALVILAYAPPRRWLVRLTTPREAPS